ncbi:MAG: bifunctional folylpolyglutamate synthase/dihydrofolate synthase [Acidobacteria bacterium]|nr:bifunctional folylpolyglutamate synthase/dihydrofolate synthase [Acidobacteriota bacterium]TDI21310.1 MAG: bifunctional folylpolyglutamate synthase/dihydrofolate synthase [Acidobacteriota bacterium]
MDALDALIALERFGIRPGLDTIRLLVRTMGDPQSSYRTVIVAGTNGKGSVVAMADHALRAAGHRVGRYTSPHLQHLPERFVVDGAVIPERELRREAAQLHEQVDRLLADGRLEHPPTFFEATTAIALSWFRRKRVDLALLEVGLGGRFDATNIVTPVAGVITPIGLEHRRYLGNTLEAIAAEKAGVIKAGMVVVTTETTPAVVALFEETCRQRGARLVRADVGTVVRVARVGDRPEILVTTPRRAYPSFRLGLAGNHQVSNATGVIRLLEALSDMGVPIDADAIVTGLSTVVWPGRLELVQVGNRGAILLDAAHNPAAAAALSTYLRATYPAGLPIVLAVMRDKDIDGIVGALAPCATRFVCTAPDTPRAVAASELAGQVRRRAGSTPVTADSTPWQAVEAAWRGSRTVCVTGSVVLVGEVLSAIDRSR